jgi:trehalose/maltose transport system substrate-binding protein
MSFAIGLAACREPNRDPVTVTYFDGGWLSAEYQDWGREALARFTEETGTVVRRLPAPESANDQLTFVRKLLNTRGSTPDVYVIDVMWPGILAEHLIDLTPRLAGEAAQQFPAMVARNTVDGRLLAIPYHASVGLLYYRADLLARYGFTGPPSTWDELEKIASVVQAGERARGQQDFWGYVWQGAAYEGLLCNALEWQMSEGGGRIIEADGSISVDNAAVVRAWERAARWVGSISPPGIVAYMEMDAHSLWESGNACFMRGWPSSYARSAADSSRVKGRFDVARLPAGAAGSASTTGENALAVSRYSRHPEEAIALVRYLSRRDIQLWRARKTTLPPTSPDAYQDPELLKSPFYSRLKEVLLKDTVERPATVTRAKYAQVSEAYTNALHEVLTRRKDAARAAADLARELAQITGLPIGRPTDPESPKRVE